MIFIYRLLPILGALSAGFVFYLQFSNPASYPWLVTMAVLGLPVVSYLMGRGRVSVASLLEKMIPAYLLLAVLAYGMLLVEGILGQAAIMLIACVSVYFSLELLFFLAFIPSRYPLNGLSRLNMAMVPIIIYYAASTSAGLLAFLQFRSWPLVVLMVVLGLILFRTTGHPESTPAQNRRWMLVGGILGLHLGLLIVNLSLALEVTGALSAIIFSLILRNRRYVYAPVPSRMQWWLEHSLAIIVLVILLVTARWL